MSAALSPKYYRLNFGERKKKKKPPNPDPAGGILIESLLTSRQRLPITCEVGQRKQSRAEIK